MNANEIARTHKAELDRMKKKMQRLTLTPDSKLKAHNILNLISESELLIYTESLAPIPNKAMIKSCANLIQYCLNYWRTRYIETMPKTKNNPVLRYI